MPIPRHGDYWPDDSDTVKDDDCDDDFGNEHEGVDDEYEPTIPCPYCLREIHEDAQRCPHCERYISEEDAPRERKHWWIIVGAVVCLYAACRWIFR